MRFLAPLTFLLTAALVHAAEVETTALTAPAHEVEVEAPDLAGRMARRACDYNGCKCDSRGKQHTACGNCVWTDNGAWLVTKKRVLTHIYECSPSGNCCDYGYAKDCGGSSARCKIY